jgi:hypothetical protein
MENLLGQINVKLNKGKTEPALKVGTPELKTVRLQTEAGVLMVPHIPQPCRAVSRVAPLQYQQHDQKRQRLSETPLWQKLLLMKVQAREKRNSQRYNVAWCLC